MLVACAGMILLSGCAGTRDGDFPSLARRPVEGVLTTVQSEPVVEPAVPPGTSLQDKLNGWTAGATTADRTFRAALPEAEARVAAARGAAAESDIWFAAHQALARLDVLRGPLTRIWSDVDALFVARTVAGDAEGAAEIAALHARIALIAAEQIGTVDRLAAGIVPR